MEITSLDIDVSTSFFMSIDEGEQVGTDCDHVEEPSSFSKSLYEGAPSGLTEYIGHLLIFQYSVRHSLTGKALDELLHLLNTFLPDAHLPKSLRQLRKFFMEIYVEQQPITQRYCSNCHILLNEGESCPCEASCSQFVTVPIGPQLKARLEGTIYLCVDLAFTY